MAKKKTKEGVYQEHVTTDIVEMHSSSAWLGISQLYRGVTFDNEEATSVTGLDGSA